MQRFVVTWVSAGNPPDLQISLQGFVRLPAPSKFVTITPLHLNIPFDMTEHSSGLILVCVRGHTPHLCFANDISYAYTWAIPFNNGGALKGEVSWVTQSNEDEKFNLRCEFMEKLHVTLQYVTSADSTHFPLTTDNCFCSMEFGVRPQFVH